MPKALRALDLYSGVGGWSLGLSMAGIKVVGSYEIREAANTTNRLNNRHPAHSVDIRELDLESLPANIDIVVGSPPCTQFSFANRGGNGDLKEGLADVQRFLTIVEKIRPKFWAMENVPRVATILRKELTARGKLRQFRHLAPRIEVLCMSEFGLPQRRRRCLAGNFNFDLLRSYAETTRALTLGDIVRALSQRVVRDPIYGMRVMGSDLLDHDDEPLLSAEEVRINRASKALHPIYNTMPFPDRLDTAARTVTATCTRVGRESIILKDDDRNGYRRLTTRERASLQGFPITFQFYSRSYREKISLIGNAMPPLMAFYVGQAFRQVASDQLERPSVAFARFKPPAKLPPKTQLAVSDERKLARRTFKFSIPSLRLKSGDRFELANEFRDHSAVWRIRFFFGTPKDIRTIKLTQSLLKATTGKLPRTIKAEVSCLLSDLRKLLAATDSSALQRSWERHISDGLQPLQLLDEISARGDMLAAIIAEHPEPARIAVITALNGQGPDSGNEAGRLAKLMANAPRVTAGILIGSLANSVLEARDRPPQPAKLHRSSAS